MNNRMKQWLVGGALGMLVLTVPLYGGSLWKAAAPEVAQAASAAESRTITVSGTGELSVKPDIAYVTIGIQTQAATAKEAQQKNAQAFAKLENVLYETFKLEKKDVQTSAFNVWPEYSYEENRSPKISGYSATHTVVVSFRDLERIGELLDAAAAAGSNRIDGIRFSTEKRADYELQAIEKAMANAEAKAKAIAAYSGKSLKGITQVIHSDRTGVVAPVYAGEMARVAADSANTSVQLGEISVTTSVTVSYEFE